MDPIPYLPLFSAVFCAVIGLLRLKQLPSLFTVFTIQAWLAVCVEIAAQIFLHYYPHRSNHIVYNIYMPFDFILLFRAGSGLLGQQSKLFDRLGVILYLTVWASSLIIQGVHTMANFSIICGALMLTIRYIQVLIWNTRQQSGSKTTSIYFISASILVYYCCMIPLFSLMHYFIRENMEMATRLFYINNGLATLRYLGTGIGLLIVSRAFRSNTALHV